MSVTFEGRVTDAFPVPGRGTALIVLPEGLPCGPWREARVPVGSLGRKAPFAGMAVRCGGREARILEVEARGIRVRACLTGRPCRPELALLTNLPSGTKCAPGARIHSTEDACSARS